MTRDLIGYGRAGRTVRWPGGARVAVCLVVNYEEGAEQSFWAGDRRNEIPQEFDYPPLGVRDLGNESIFEYGARAGIWRLQRLFDTLRLPVTIQGCAQAFELNPEVGAWIEEAGHDVCCHGYRWENVSVLPREVERERLAMAIESITSTCGRRPRGWYSRQPASVNTRELLVEEGGFLYDSDSFADDLPYYTEVLGRRHLIIPYSFTLNDGRFLPGQSYSGPEVFLDHCRRAFDQLWEEGGAGQPKMMTIGLHPRFVGQPARAHALGEFLRYAQDRGEVWFAGREDIARLWLGRSWAFELCDSLLAATGASRTTVRLGEAELAAESRAPGVRGMDAGPAIDPRAFPTYQYLRDERRLLIQDDCRTGDPRPPASLVEHHRVYAQMLAPIVVRGELAGTISVHQQDTTRTWTDAEVAALAAARARAEKELG
ncbi:GAF domain-containing protein [Nonomuraea insulae]|uniref:GAF domain-containing protein n=1 Tax=Nonomuraea insulae TaxID=1616787 RepID=A0ABW1DA25_9ACTN